MTPRSRRKGQVCRACGAVRPSGPDPCLGWLPGVRNACCGHGTRRSCSVMLYADFVRASIPELFDEYDVEVVPGDGGKGRGVRTYAHVVIVKGDAAWRVLVSLGGSPAILAHGSEAEYLNGWITREEQ